MNRTIRKVNPALPKPPKILNVAAYARVSLEKDSMLHSLSAQISHYSGLIQRHPGWRYAGVYADKALPVPRWNARNFSACLRTARRGKST